MGQQQLRNVLAVLGCGKVQRSPAIVGLSVDISLGGQQKFCQILVALGCCHMQGRYAELVVLAENQIRVVFEQRLDLCQIALLGRGMDLAAEGAAPAKQRDQKDSGEQGNRGTERQAEERTYTHDSSEVPCSVAFGKEGAAAFGHIL